ncbi:imidazolonepropionase [Halobacterium salinarum]|uniref:Imidazolonepropionase n=1 Tax=Halobacterium salinarum (strain ATCC 33171 / DSM 3754 / JCM 8978 / NBRC 102687 / NCIMB 764 / 91-R6) TaxID=2597657 RepID=A0A4D6GWR6_HALS9|nr:imidazolonepropionase [Halobacterium salinarum]QCC45028.1 imidazolonepropionase [Halobacterium salinarum]TYO76140.1 imidazolonepropionase [Halobacterium salinarum DSM 3754]
MSSLDAVVHGARELVVGPAAGGSTLETHADGAVAVVDGAVAAVGDTADVLAAYPAENATTAIDATGKTVLPGFVDPHTHALFAGDRSDEFAAKLRGKPYQEILAEGGGILRTVDAVRAASDAALVANLTAQLDVMLAHGTTTAEVKTGYGLDTETECRMLDAIAAAAAEHPVDVVTTFLGAHAVPDDTDADAYVDAVIADQLPAAANGPARFCDVFCEADVFTVEQSRRILDAGREHGLAPKLHAEEFTRLGGAQLAADLGATSADHLLHATPEDAAALADAGVTPVLLPATAFVLDEAYADPQQFLAAADNRTGAPVALGTDLNPNCYTHSMGFVVSLACNGMRMAPADAVLAATAWAASALDRSQDGTGTLREGTDGDVLVVDAPSHVHLPYNPGVNNVEAVLTDGTVAVGGGGA